MSWPPRWDGPNFKKGAGAAKVERKAVKAGRVNLETLEKRKVRTRDRVCRFPLCGCKRFGFALHVSHQQHKGIGGNPKGDRSKAAKMILLCQPRHQGCVSIDKGTLRWKALTDAGASGPVTWEVRRDALGPMVFYDARFVTGSGAEMWLELARERAPGVLEPLEDWQRVILTSLSKMQN